MHREGSAPAACSAGLFNLKVRKTVERSKGFLENMPIGDLSGNETFLSGCAPQESLITVVSTLGQIFPDILLDFQLFQPKLRSQYRA